MNVRSGSVAGERGASTGEQLSLWSETRRGAHLLEPGAAIVIKFLFSGRDPHAVLNLTQPEVKPIA